MKKNIANKNIWKIFLDFCAVPRLPEHNEPPIKFITDFLNKYNVKHVVDKAGNIFARINATKGFSKKPSILLQAHYDMVCVSAAPNYDFNKAGVKPIIRGDLITADGTSLGGDDGVGIAMMLSLLTEKDLPHGKIELLFTSDEEIGLVGAKAFNCKNIKSKLLINLDSEEERKINVGCLGSARLTLNIPIKKEKFNGQGYVSLAIQITNLFGGHSAIQIEEKHLNAIKLLFYLLSLCNNNSLLISGFDQCGSFHNSIPTEATVFVSMQKNEVEKFKKNILSHFNTIKEGQPNEKRSQVKITTIPTPNIIMNKKLTNRLIDLFNALPNGVFYYDKKNKIAEDSCNIGRLIDKGTDLEVWIMNRGLYMQSLLEKVHQMEAFFKLCGINIKYEDPYPGWISSNQNPLIDVYIKEYKKLYGAGQKIEANLSKGGVEPAIFVSRVKGLHAISVGPNCEYVHSIKEKLNISSTERVYETIKNVIKNIR